MKPEFENTSLPQMWLQAGGKQLSVLQRVTGWLSGRSSNNAQTAYGAAPGTRGYYGSSQAEDAYGSMYAERSADTADNAYSQEPNAPADQYQAGRSDPYGGRVPYQSQRDRQAELEARERQAQEAYQQHMQADMRHRRTDNQQMPYQQPDGNVVDFPGQASMPTHVEYVILLRSRNECTKVIEYIKTNASVFLNMEYIANESERQRCVDMLSGAAYTLGCQLHKISNRGIYLIASPYVRVMIDPAMKRFNATTETQPFMAQRTGEYPPASAYTTQRQPLTPAQSFGGGQSGMAGNTTAPYPQQQPHATQQQPPPQQGMYSSFQRPRPTFQSQTQQEPYRRAAGGQRTGRRPAAYQTPY